MPWPEDAYTFEADNKFVAGIATTAGHCEVSRSLARAVGLVGGFSSLYGAVQFRGVVPPSRRAHSPFERDAPDLPQSAAWHAGAPRLH